MSIVLVPDSLLAELSAAAVRIAPGIDLVPYFEDDAPIPRLGEAVGIMRGAGGSRFSKLVAAGPNIRWLHTASAGVDHVLTPEVRARQGIVVTDSGPAFEIAISEFVLAWMLMVARRLPELMEHQRAHRWNGVKQRELSGATVGIVGLGPIGRGVAQRAKGFGMRVVGVRRSDAPVENVDETLIGPSGLDRLLAESDYVVLAAALTGETQALIGADRIALMKSDAWLINIARGGMVDEPALIAALKERRIGGACLDVFAKEPLPPDSPLWDLSNVHITPHDSSGGTEGLARRRDQIFLENLRRFSVGEPLENVVDMAQGY